MNEGRSFWGTKLCRVVGLDSIIQVENRSTELVTFQLQYPFLSSFPVSH